MHAGELRRVAAGSYVRSRDWAALKPMQRHRIRVLEVVRRSEAPVVISHIAAAAIWGIDVLGAWPIRADVIVERTSGGRSSGAVRRRALGLSDVDRVPFGRHELTTPSQTAIDLARVLPFVRGVSVVDQALWNDRRGGPLTTPERVEAALVGTPGHRGQTRARRVLEFASPLAANVRESQGRVVIAQLGFPEPRLQERRVLPSGRVVFGDFYFPIHDHWAELDGRGKYLDPELLNGKSTAEAVLDEKDRENEIRRTVRAFSRFEPADLDRPRRLYDILAGDGLPSSLPRP